MLTTSEVSVTHEQKAWRSSAFPVLFGLGVIIALALLVLLLGINDVIAGGVMVFGLIILAIVFLLLCNGLKVISPNEARVFTFFGNYIGSVRESGFFFVNPLTATKKISLKVRNFNSDTLKVNDAQGNPIEIAAVVVWRVVDSAKASFDVENYKEFVALQSETAIRALANHYPYENHQDQDIDSLRGNPEKVGDALKDELHKRFAVAGVDVLEARISHLAYAQEIAQAMLKRQQAQAIISARQQIVVGAVGMVEDALTSLSDKNIVELDNERRATMVNNLMVALVSENNVQPVIQASNVK